METVGRGASGPAIRGMSCVKGSVVETGANPDPDPERLNNWV